MSKKHLIWDLPVRIFHWSFAIAIIGSWYTAENADLYIDLHMQLGYFILGLLTFRIIWGVIGPKHARFSNFIPSPKAIITYIKHINDKETTAGHNPLGALMVLFMIVIILAQAVSGLFITDDIFSSGPYYGEISKELEKVMSFIHHNNFNFILAAICLHLLAIGFYWRVKNKNLVLPMITGEKSDEEVCESDAIPNSKIILGVVIALCCAAFIYWLVVINAPVIEEFY